MDKEQKERFRRAVDEKEQQAQRQAVTAEQKLDAPDRDQEDIDPRKRSSRHGKVTADKWNQ